MLRNAQVQQPTQGQPISKADPSRKHAHALRALVSIEVSTRTPGFQGMVSTEVSSRRPV
jgi:hypothetical protein